VRAFARSGACSVIIITHKFREVMAYADAVTVLRKGRAVHHGLVADSTPALLAAAMMGESTSEGAAPASVEPKSVAESAPLAADRENPLKVSAGGMAALLVSDLSAMGDRGTMALHAVNLQVQPGEILGVAGVSGNGQRELVEALVGQRPRAAGSVQVSGQPYAATRKENRQLMVRSLPEEPLRNACVGELSVAENMALRDFDQPPLSRSHFLGGVLNFPQLRSRARSWIADYGVKTQGENAPIRSLSGGNVQRAVLARELAGEIKVLIAANPVFGLDFVAVHDIHSRMVQVKNMGAGVLLISEDLDELLELSDRIVVMSEGRIVFETLAGNADRQQLGAHMGGGHH
jgi:simple sugar transport system ATP-binding protein